MKFPAHVDEAAFCGRLDRFLIETPSWGYADTGTRFGKFQQDAAATTWREKLDDAAQVHRHTGCCPSVAVHALWDFPAAGREPVDERELADEAREVAAYARSLGLRVGSINPNVFQDQRYKFGSLCHRDGAVRERAKRHILDCIEIGRATGSKVLSLWFADGTNYPGQADIRRRKRWMAEGLAEIHAAMPGEMTMLVEYKPFEPAFYHTDIADWGMAYVFAKAAGERAKVLVDTGHHLPGCNIEHIVAFLIDEGMLGGFHFNDRKYADDDLMMGSMDPYQLFRIFCEIVGAEREETGGKGLPPGRDARKDSRTGGGAERESGGDMAIEYMIDQSHNVEPKIQAMIQSVMNAQELFAKALMIDRAAIAQARETDDVILAERALKDAFSTDVRPLLTEYRQSRKLPGDPLLAFRESGYEARVAAERGPRKSKDAGGYA